MIAATTAQGRVPAAMDERAWRTSFCQWTEQQVRDELQGNTTSVIELDGQRVGRLRIVRDGECIELAGIQLMPEVQGRGIGTAIIESLKVEAAAADLAVELGVEKDNPDAHRLYSRLGFVGVGETEDEHRLRWPSLTTSSITVTHDADPALRSQVQALLRAYNAPFGVTTPNAKPLVARATGADGALLGGCVAETFWSWLVIDVLAVDEVARAQGIGSALVDATEAEARSRGCTRAHTTAWAFQGLTFWTQRGYQIVGQLDDFPDGHTMCWLRRDL